MLNFMSMVYYELKEKVFKLKKTYVELGIYFVNNLGANWNNFNQKKSILKLYNANAYAVYNGSSLVAWREKKLISGVREQP